MEEGRQATIGYVAAWRLLRHFSDKAFAARSIECRGVANLFYNAQLQFSESYEQG